MMYSHTEIFELTEYTEPSDKMRVFTKIIRLWNEHKKKQMLKSFNEIEPNVFVLKQEITERIKLKSKRNRERKLKSKN